MGAYAYAVWYFTGDDARRPMSAWPVSYSAVIHMNAAMEYLGSIGGDW